MATASDTQSAARSVERVDSLVWLTLIIAASIALRLVVNTRFQAPTILTDELTYSNLARQIADGRLTLSSGYGIVYPLLMAPSWAIAKFGADAYTYMKTTNAVLVSLTAVPVFLWARRLMRPGYALVAAGLTLLLPGMAYSGTIMTENAFVLFFMVAVWATAVAVERPTIPNQVLLLVAVAVAIETRAQAAVLLLALPCVIVLAALAEERSAGAFSWSGCGRRLARFWPLAAVAALGVAAVALRTLLTDWRWSQLLQAYSSTADGRYTGAGVSRYLLWHLGEAAFALGVIPVAALLVLIGPGLVGRTRSTAERAYLCTAVVVIPLVILQVAAFMSYWAQRVSERNMFCVFPIVLIGLALWLDRGLPRPRWTAALAAAIAGGLVLCVPFGYLYQRAPSTETWAVVAPDILTRKLPGGADDVQVLIVIGVAVALLVFGIVRTRAAVPIAIVVLAGYFLVGMAAAAHQVGKTARDYRSIPSLGADPSWLDAATPDDGEVLLLLGGTLGPDSERVLAWQTEFFNRRPFAIATWGRELGVDARTGAITTQDGRPTTLPPYVITPSSFRIAGTVVADRGAYLLVSPSKPYRVDTQSWGFYADGLIAPSAMLIDYAHGPSPSTLHVHLDRVSPLTGTTSATATVTVGTLAVDANGAPAIGAVSGRQSAPVSPAQAAELEVDVPRGPFMVRIDITPGFRPSDAGLPDTREIGAAARLSLDGQALPG